MTEKNPIADVAEIALNIATRLLPFKHRWVHLSSRLEKAGLNADLVKELKIAAELSQSTGTEIGQQESKWLLSQDNPFRMIVLRRRAGDALLFEGMESGYQEVLRLPRPLAILDKWGAVAVSFFMLFVGLGFLWLALLSLSPIYQLIQKGESESLLRESLPALGQSSVMALIAIASFVLSFGSLKSFVSTSATQKLVELSKPKQT